MEQQQKQGHHVEIQNDILQSMGSQISDLQISLSKISIKNKQLEQQVYKQRTKSCINGHPMRYMYTKTTSQSAFHSCDLCKKSVGKNTNVFWSCSKCDFDLCRHCGGYKRSVCVFSHPLQYRQKKSNGTVRCDICHTTGLKATWHCECDFDICDKCYKMQ